MIIICCWIDSNRTQIKWAMIYSNVNKSINNDGLSQSSSLLSINNTSHMSIAMLYVHSIHLSLDIIVFDAHSKGMRCCCMMLCISIWIGNWLTNSPTLSKRWLSVLPWLDWHDHYCIIAPATAILAIISGGYVVGLALPLRLVDACKVGVDEEMCLEDYSSWIICMGVLRCLLPQLTQSLPCLLRLIKVVMTHF